MGTPKEYVVYDLFKCKQRDHWKLKIARLGFLHNEPFELFVPRGLRTVTLARAVFCPSPLSLPPATLLLRRDEKTHRTKCKGKKRSTRLSCELPRMRIHHADLWWLMTICSTLTTWHDRMSSWLANGYVTTISYTDSALSSSNDLVQHNTQHKREVLLTSFIWMVTLVTLVSLPSTDFWSEKDITRERVCY